MKWSARTLLLQVLLFVPAYVFARGVIPAGSVRETLAPLVVASIVAAVGAALIALYGMTVRGKGPYSSLRARGQMIFHVGIAHFSLPLAAIPAAITWEIGFHPVPLSIAALFLASSLVCWKGARAVE